MSTTSVCPTIHSTASQGLLFILSEANVVVHLLTLVSPPRAWPLSSLQVPKVDAKTLAPAVWPTNPQLEWCPPGHGDLYAALDGSGTLDNLLAAGASTNYAQHLIGSSMHAGAQ